MTTPTPPPLTDADIRRRIETAETIIEEAREVGDEDEDLTLLAHDYLHTLQALTAERAASLAAEERGRGEALESFAAWLEKHSADERCNESASMLLYVAGEARAWIEHGKHLADGAAKAGEGEG